MPRPGRPTTERAKDFKGTLRQLIRTMSHYKLPLAAAMLFAILSTIFNIAGPKVLAKATTALATGWIARLRGTGSIDFVYIGRILLFLLGMYLLSSAFSFIQGWLMTGLSQKVCYDFRRQISEKINRLPLAYFEKRTVGEVLSRITNDVDTLGQSLNQSIADEADGVGHGVHGVFGTIDGQEDAVVGHTCSLILTLMRLFEGIATYVTRAETK